MHELTTLNTGLGDDHVTVKLAANPLASFALNTQGAINDLLKLTNPVFTGSRNGRRCHGAAECTACHGTTECTEPFRSVSSAAWLLTIRTLFTRRRSASSTSTLRPSNSKRSPTAGTRPIRDSR